MLRLGLSNPDLIERFTGFRYGNHRITNFEMETAGIYALATLLGHTAYSFSALLANRAAGTFHDEPARAVESLIRKVLNWAVELDA